LGPALDSLRLPSVSNPGGATYSFAAPAPSSIRYTLNAATGQLDFTSSIITSVNGVGVTDLLTLTTGTSNGGTPCGGLPALLFSGSPVNGTTGAATLLGGTCVPAKASDNGPWLVAVKLVGVLSPIPSAPEPSTALLLSAGLVGLAVRRRHARGASHGGHVSEAFELRRS
jgi:hypothetical protein